MTENILELRDVKTHFPIHTGFLVKKHTGSVRAVDGVTLSVRRGEVLGLVGESGCGKSTLARTILQLVPTTGGMVVLNGRNLGEASRAEMQACRREQRLRCAICFSILRRAKNSCAANRLSWVT